jgi:hypothetical protein
MLAAEETKDHVPAHPPESDEPEFHSALHRDTDQRRCVSAAERSRITSIMSS